jgi:glycosyltransferase involved in cell wall biosynthesis
LKKVVLLTPGQPSTNPRLVKEAIACSEAGYTVVVLYCFWAAWADAADDELFKQYPQIKWIRVGGHPAKAKATYFFTRLKYKAARFLSSKTGVGIVQERAEMRCYDEMLAACKKIKADVYIAHNLGALPVAAKAAYYHKVKYAFDIEDYHRGQFAENSTESKRAALLEDNYLPGTAWCTAASPLIADKYSEHYHGLQPVIINNVFSSIHLCEQPNYYTAGQPLKLFWFSQTVGARRGLEDAISALGILRDMNISLTILGSCNATTKQWLLQLTKQNEVPYSRIVFMGPEPLAKLFGIANAHHIGLATETGFTTNNSIALSNKLFTYLLSGLAVLTGNTAAQQNFMHSNAGIGATYPSGNAAVMATLLQQWYSQPALLAAMQYQSWQLAREKYNWEKEKPVFLSLLQQALK